MDCPICQRFEAEVKRVEGIHAEKLPTAEVARWQLGGQGEYRVLQSGESDARLYLEIMRAV